MKNLIKILAVLILLPSFAFSGEIYGVIKDNYGTRLPGVKVTLIFGNGSTYTYTDQYGSYYLYISGTGWAELELNVPGCDPQPKIAVHFYHNAVRYNLIKAGCQVYRE
ncbi:MAG: hypothetical protein GY839_17755 [candidate division Zixibacteria bacterium]|nr:hypothetical protein [candidate division Zixibacteria bacterium]